jgi:EAL domain-containing protein (putative c-di-GMP-specific phosphodiesterase class I)
VDIVKIDQSFIADIGIDPSGGDMVEAISNLAHVLRLSVTAEGVETEQQHDLVTAVGCDHAQGFRYGHPVRAGAVIDLLPRRWAGSDGSLRVERRPVA